MCHSQASQRAPTVISTRDLPLHTLGAPVRNPAEIPEVSSALCRTLFDCGRTSSELEEPFKCHVVQSQPLTEERRVQGRHLVAESE